MSLAKAPHSPEAELANTVALETGVEIAQRDVLGHLQATQQSLRTNFVVALVIVYLVMTAIVTHWGYPLLIMVNDPARHRRRYCRPGVAQCGRRAASAGRPRSSAPALRHDLYARLPDPARHRGQQPDPDRGPAMSNVRDGEQDAVAAVREAVDARLRPITMSAITTIAGLSPLVFLPGAGAELYRGVGAIVLFGILGAAIVTLTLLPALTVTVTVLGMAEGRRRA